MKKVGSDISKGNLHYYKKPSVEIINYIYDDVISTSGCDMDRHDCPTKNGDNIWYSSDF